MVGKISNPISRDVNFGVDRILEGYLTEIAVDTIRSYNETKIYLFKGPRGHYLKSLKIMDKDFGMRKRDHEDEFR